MDEREQRVVLPAAHIEAGFVTRATLGNQDRTRVNQLAAESLHSQPLTLRVATVYGGAATLLMCHKPILFPAGSKSPTRQSALATARGARTRLKLVRARYR